MLSYILLKSSLTRTPVAQYFRKVYELNFERHRSYKLDQQAIEFQTVNIPLSLA